MGIALFTIASLLVPVQTAFKGCAAGARRMGLMGARALAPVPGARSDVPAGATPCQSLRASVTSAHRPLRVVRVVEGGRGVGRMVISGRMADVCAELDRLAAHEV